MSTKSVIIVDGSLPTGLKANTAAVLAFSLGKACPELVGPPVRCVDGTELPGITTTPLPILESASPALAALHGEAAAGGLTVFCFTDSALNSRHYDDYIATCAETASAEMTFHGVLVHGPRKAVNRLCGGFPLLR